MRNNIRKDSPKVLGLDVSTKTIGWSLFDIETGNLLLNSNNVYTVSTLMRFNTLICKEVYDVLGVVPEFISTYNSRKFAFPHLVQENDKGKFVLFGGLPKDIDKKQVIWDLVAKREPQITWNYTKNNTLKKENFDQTDAYCAALGYMKMKEIW
jgi:hypothetical protein